MSREKAEALSRTRTADPSLPSKPSSKVLVLGAREGNKGALGARPLGCLRAGSIDAARLALRARIASTKRSTHLAVQMRSLRGDGRSWLSTADRGERRSDAFGEVVRRGAGREVEDPGGELGVGSLDAVAVELEEGQHGDQREPLVAVDEELPLGDAVGEHRRLQGEVGVLVAGVGRRSGERAFQA